MEKENKICSVCKKEYKRTNEFFQRCSQKKDGLRPECKSCSKKCKKTIAYIDNLERKKQLRKEKKEKYLQSEEYKQKLIISKQKEKDRKNKWREKNKEKLKIKQTERRLLGKIKPITPEKRKEYKKRQYEKLMADPYKRMIALARGRMRCFIKKNAKQFKIKDMLIFTSEEFISSIESKFKDGMTWDNYGKKGWHIDHIKPISKFDLNNIDECKECWSINNLQPLWWHENLKKSNKIIL